MLRFATALALALGVIPALFQGAGTRLRVVDTALNDVPNVRELPTTESRTVGVIPPDARDLTFLGGRRGNWVFVRYPRAEGWVSSRFVVPAESPARRGRNLDDEEQ